MYAGESEYDFFPSKFRALKEKALWEEVSKSGFIAINWQLMGTKKHNIQFCFVVQITEPGSIQNLYY